jgi:hypothetical protein
MPRKRVPLTNEQRRSIQAAKLERLRAALQLGIDELDRGDFTEVEDKDLDAFLDDLATSPRR